jgi:N-acetylglutamate synthase-like GNAT family acetyltransferase
MTADLSGPSTARSAELNMRDWYLRVLLAAGGEVHHANGFVWGYGERALPHHGRGGIIPFPGSSGHDFREAFERMMRDFAARDATPWCTMGHVTTPPEVRAAFKTAGFSYLFPGVCMASSLEPERLDRPMPPGVVVRSLEEVPATAVGEHPSYGQPGEENATMLAAMRKLEASSPRRFWTFLAFRGEELVASTTLYVDRGDAGIYDVGTLAPQRRGGVASALVAMACRKARALGCRKAYLQCHLSLTKFYGGFGFHVVSTIEHWSGRPTMLQIAALAPEPESLAAEDFLTAALTGDVATAQRVLHDHPVLARQPLAGSQGATPLHVAAYHGASDAVRMLLEAKADLDTVEDRFGDTPLGWAIHALGPKGPVFKRDQWGAVNSLLQAGAQLTPELAESLRGTDFAKADQMLATSAKSRSAPAKRDLGKGS